MVGKEKALENDSLVFTNCGKCVIIKNKN